MKNLVVKTGKILQEVSMSKDDDELIKAIKDSGGYEWTPDSPWPPELPNTIYNIKAKMIDDYLFGDTDTIDDKPIDLS